MLPEALAPFTDDLAWEIEPRGDVLILQALRGIENELRAHDLEIRCRILAGEVFEVLALSGGEPNDEWTVPGHATSGSEQDTDLERSKPVYTSP
jgi:hypothetical protein